VRRKFTLILNSALFDVGELSLALALFPVPTIAVVVPNEFSPALSVLLSNSAYVIDGSDTSEGWNLEKVVWYLPLAFANGG
jgi:hypothetical protein